jgi:hypothetical protein
MQEFGYAYQAYRACLLHEYGQATRVWIPADGPAGDEASNLGLNVARYRAGWALSPPKLKARVENRQGWVSHHSVLQARSPSASRAGSSGGGAKPRRWTAPRVGFLEGPRQYYYYHGMILEYLAAGRSRPPQNLRADRGMESETIAGRGARGLGPGSGA